MLTLGQLVDGDDGMRQIIMALAVPVAGMLSARCIEAGFGLWVGMAFTAIALCTLLNRERLDVFFWTHVIGEDSNELFQLRSRRQQGRFEIAKKGMSVQLLCAVLFHASRFDLQGATVPLVIVSLMQMLKPEQARFLAYFINSVPFNLLCFLRGGGPDENFLWSPVLILPLWNLLVIPSVSTHAGLELLRLAAVLHFCAIAELRLVVASTCVLMTVYRVLEGNYDMKLVVGCRTERRVNECVNRERKQLVGVLSHEVRNRLDILTNLIAEKYVEGLADGAAARRKMPITAVLQQSVQLQQSVSVVLDLLEIEEPKRDIDIAAVLLAAAPQPPPSPLLLPEHGPLDRRVRTQLRLVVHSAQRLQVEALQHVAAINTAAAFSVHIDEQLCAEIEFSKARLHWILCHLIANAYAGCGAAADAGVHVDVALDQRAETVVIEVVNTVGAQLTQATLDQALLGHKQAANSHTRRWGGHGLGLRHTAAMLKLLECPPLSLTAKANAVTARFSIPYRPCAPSRSPSTVGSPFDEIDAFNDGGGDGGGGSGVDGDGGTTGEAHSSPAARPAPRLRSVLAVDDEEFIRTLTQLTLEDQCEGCVVVTAENGEEGVALFLERRKLAAAALAGGLSFGSPEFDLVLMDIQMPVLCGDLAAKQMRALERQHGWPQTCIVARSANTAEADQAHYKQCGLDGCIPKCGNIAKQVLEALAKKRKQPDEFVTVDTGATNVDEGLASS